MGALGLGTPVSRDGTHVRPSYCVASICVSSQEHVHSTPLRALQQHVGGVPDVRAHHRSGPVPPDYTPFKGCGKRHALGLSPTAPNEWR